MQFLTKTFLFIAAKFPRTVTFNATLTEHGECVVLELTRSKTCRVTLFALFKLN